MTTLLGSLVVLILVWVTPAPVHAALISVDDLVFGSGAITRDTDTGLEWLDVALSANRSWNDITGVDGSNEFLPGGDFAGFRHATSAEVAALYTNAGIPLINGTDPSNIVPGLALVDLLGPTGVSPSNPEYRFLFGVNGDPPFPGSPTLRRMSTLIRTQLGGVETFEAFALSPNGFPSGAVDPGYGHMLVREVPEPSTLLLLASVAGETIVLSRTRRRTASSKRNA